MSHKIYKSNADRQAAYRARSRRQACDAYWANAVTDWRGMPAEQLEKMKSAHKRGCHRPKLRGLDWIDIGHPYCPLCQTAELLTVTPNPVTVETDAAPPLTFKELSPRCIYCRATYFKSMAAFNRHNTQHIYTHDEHWKRYQQEQLEKYGDGSDTVTQNRIPAADRLTVRLTKVQIREVTAVLGDEKPEGLTVTKSALIFHSTADYCRIGKLLIERLYKRERDLDIRPTTDHRLLDWHDKSPEGVAAKKTLAIANGAISACRSALSDISFGDVDSDDIDDTRSLEAWRVEYEDAQSENFYAAIEARTTAHEAAQNQIPVTVQPKIKCLGPKVIHNRYNQLTQTLTCPQCVEELAKGETNEHRTN